MTALAGGVFLVAIVVAGLVTSQVTYWGDFYPREFYPMDKALDYLDLAGATSDLHEMAADLNQSLSFLAPFHGNPQWWYPTPNTDFDLIKTDIATTVGVAVNASHAGPQNFSYQQTVQTLHGSTIPNLHERISEAETYWQGSVKTDAGQFSIIGTLAFVIGGIAGTIFFGTRKEFFRKPPPPRQGPKMPWDAEDDS